MCLRKAGEPSSGPSFLRGCTLLSLPSMPAPRPGTHQPVVCGKVGWTLRSERTLHHPAWCQGILAWTGMDLSPERGA